MVVQPDENQKDKEEAEKLANLNAEFVRMMDEKCPYPDTYKSDE